MSSSKAPAIHGQEDLGKEIEKWSPLIGIVTAIVGNILISIALNIQRYAHIRLGREQEEEKGHWLKRKKRKEQKSYGTQQSDIAEERLRINLEADAWKDGDNVDDTPSKLVRPTSPTGSTHSSSSESTVKPSEKESAPQERKTYLKSPYWWAGIVLMVIGEGGNFLAYGFAPASIVSPLGVVALISNCIIAPCLLKERFRQRDFWGVLIAIGGTVTIVLSAKSEEKKMGQDDILEAVKRWEFLTYLGITVAVIIVLLWASPRYGHRTILIDLGLVGLFGEYTALSTKGIASLLSDTLWRTLTFPITYILILVLIGTALMQIRYVNRALQRFDSTQVIPVQFVIFTISVIVGSAVLYRDFESATKERMLKFVGGCLLTFLGVYYITSARSQESTNYNELDYDEEQAIDLRDEEQYEDEVHQTSSTSNRKASNAASSIAVSSRRPSQQQDPTLPHTPVRTLSQPLSTTSEDIDPTLLSNPWRSSTSISSQPRPPPMPSITSPLLPSEATRSNAPTPSDPSTPDRATPIRRLKSRLSHTPLISPLSPSFSAVVADQRRRAAERTSSSLRRPRLSRTRISRGSQSHSHSQSQQDDDSGVGTGEAEQGQSNAENGGRPRQSRSQSITAAVGEFFRRKGEGGMAIRRESREEEA